MQPCFDSTSCFDYISVGHNGHTTSACPYLHSRPLKFRCAETHCYRQSLKVSVISVELGFLPPFVGVAIRPALLGNGKLGINWFQFSNCVV